MTAHHERVRFCVICGARLVEPFDDMLHRLCSSCTRAGAKLTGGGRR